MRLTNLINFLFEGEDYRGVHRAPGKNIGAPLWDVTKDVYPDDIYTLPLATAARYYGASEAGDIPVMRMIRRYSDNPEGSVEIYRAVPDTKDIEEINPGDWVSIYRPYVVEHGEGALGGEYKVLSKTVMAKDLYTDGNSIYEWGWDPT